MLRRSLFTAARPALAQAARTAMVSRSLVTPSPFRPVSSLLSSSSSRSFSSLSDSRRTLTECIKAELPDYSTNDDWVSDYLSDSGLSLEVDTAKQTVVATKTVEGHSITLAFDAQEMEEPEPEQEQEEEQAQEQQEEKFVEQTFVANVKNAKGKHLTVYCYATEGGELAIEQLSFKDKFDVHYSCPENESEASLLVFDDLSDDMQDNLIAYMESLGITDDTAKFVQKQAQLVRTANYTDKLQALQKFVQ